MGKFKEVDFNVNDKQLKEMLGAAQKSSNRELQDLAKQLVKEGVRVTAGSQKGGLGGGGLCT